MAIFQQSPARTARFGSQPGADGRVRPRFADVSCTRSAAPPGAGETSRIQRMVEREGAEENGTSTELG